MAKLLPFQRTSRLISETDEFLDKVAEALMLFERAIDEYADDHSEEGLDQRLEQLFAVESRADELRRSTANTMYSEMLMPETRGDLTSLAVELDVILDSCVHLIARMSMERPPMQEQFKASIKDLVSESVASGQALIKAARAYMKEPHAVRNHLHEIAFHNKEAAAKVLKLGKAVFDSDMPIENKRRGLDYMLDIRRLASTAEDIGDRLGILAIKRAD